MLRHEEQFFAFMCHLSDQNRSNYDSKISRRLMAGIKNNLPHLYPKVLEGSNARRRGLRQFGMEKPRGKTLSELPMVELPFEVDPVIRKVVTKIGLALYYLHKGRPAQGSMVTSAYWGQSADRNGMAKFAEVVKNLHSFQRTNRRNVELGDRFSYAWGTEEDGEPDIFVAVAKFGQGLVTCLMISGPEAVDEHDDGRDWLAVSDFAEGCFPKEWLILPS